MAEIPWQVKNVYDLAVHLARLQFPFANALREFRRAYVMAVLINCQWNQCKAARLLGMHRNTLARQMQEFEIVVPIRRPGMRKMVTSESAPVRKVG
jgi:Fis family transcriptional regulator, factor for inversion stimulation protein